MDFSQIEQQMKLAEDTLAVKKAQQAVEDAITKQHNDQLKEATALKEAQLAVQKAREAEREANLKAHETDLKDVGLLADKINQVAEGTIKWKDANLLTEASAQKLREAVVKAASMDAGGGPPTAIQVFMKMSELFHAAGGAAMDMNAKMALVQQTMGAGFRAGQASASQLIAVLNKGPEALKQFMEEGEKFRASSRAKPWWLLWLLGAASMSARWRTPRCL